MLQSRGEDSYRVLLFMSVFSTSRWAVNGKLLESEDKVLRICLINLGAMRTLATLLSCNKYSELLLDPAVLVPPFVKEVRKRVLNLSSKLLLIIKNCWPSVNLSALLNINRIWFDSLQDYEEKSKKEDDLESERLLRETLRYILRLDFRCGCLHKLLYFTVYHIGT